MPPVKRPCGSSAGRRARWRSHAIATTHAANPRRRTKIEDAGRTSMNKVTNWLVAAREPHSAIAIHRPGRVRLNGVSGLR
jgi:hypothetical protein